MDTIVADQQLHINLANIEVPSGCKTVVVHLPGNILLQAPAPTGGNTPTVMLAVADLRKYATEYIVDLKLRNNYKSGISLNDHDKRIEQFADWVEERSQTVAAQHWRDYYAEKKEKLKPLTVRNYFRSLKPFAEWLVKKQMMIANPLADITPPKPPKVSIRSKAIPIDAIQLMLDHVKDEREQALLLFFRDTACRLAEAQVANWENIDWEKGEVYTIGKFGKPRTLYVTTPTAAALQAYQKTLKNGDIGSMWRSERGNRRLTKSGIYQIFHRVARRVEKQIKHNPHAFRHAFGRDAVDAGISIVLLKEIFDHESIETTMIYTEVDTKAVREAHNRFSPLNNLDAD
jgi:integrase/recombinase XerC